MLRERLQGSVGGLGYARVDLATAREKVRVARRLEELPARDGLAVDYNMAVEQLLDMLSRPRVSDI